MRSPRFVFQRLREFNKTHEVFKQRIENDLNLSSFVYFHPIAPSLIKELQMPKHMILWLKSYLAILDY